MRKTVLEEFGENAWSCEICDKPTPPGQMMCAQCEAQYQKDSAMLAARTGGE